MVLLDMLRYLLLDLDNTLYSENLGMEQDIVHRMNDFVASYLGVDRDHARDIRRAQRSRFGTTLEWLMNERGFEDPERYFATIHPEGEEYCIQPDPRLRPLLDSIALPKAVFTNSPSEHAERVLRKLGVRDRFEAVYDIRFCKLRGKPYASAFLSVCDACGVKPEEAVFVDDMPTYVRGFVELGGRGFVLDEFDRHADSGLGRIRSLAELPALLAGELGPATH